MVGYRMDRVAGTAFLKGTVLLFIATLLLLQVVVISVSPVQNVNAQGFNLPPNPGYVVQIEYRYINYYHTLPGDPVVSDDQQISFRSNATVIQPFLNELRGNGTGHYKETYDDNCGTAFYNLLLEGEASMEVRIRGDTSRVQVSIRGENLTHVESDTECKKDGLTTYNQYGYVEASCTFSNVDLENGGSFKSDGYLDYADEDEHSEHGCLMTIFPSGAFRIFGKVSSMVEGVQGLNSVPISNARVAIAEIAQPTIKKLSESKPSFFKKTATSDDSDAKYEFSFADPGKPRRILVVSLLWYEGKPEFAVTNGKNDSGRFIPVYQAMCVDEDPATECLKWKRTADGSYEAEVDFLYGSQQKLLDIITFMELEDWEGTGGNARIQMNSGYMYYNSYRAMKYLENLGLGTQLRPVMIKSHHIDNECPIGADNAWYGAHGPRPTFGDLGSLLDKVEATGSGAYICDGASPASYPDAPLNREWHELGHYLLYEMHAPNFPESSTRGIPHKGYSNNSTNDSYIEGMASFFAMLTNEFHGHPHPDLYRVGASMIDVELNYKAWSGDDEEFAVAGVLWDLHDSGKEVGVGFMRNGTLAKASKVYPSPTDTVSLDAKTILQELEGSKATTAVDIYNAFVGLGISQEDLDMIFVDHGFFADVEDRNYIHDSAAETIPESGSKTGPVRLVRHSPVPTIPGAYLASNSDATFNVTISYPEPFEYSDYSYILEMKAGSPAYFEMPPEYYPSTAFITPISGEGKPLPGGIEIDSGEYWTYVSSNPPVDGVFKSISVEGGSGSDTFTAVEYIQNVKDLLSRVSAEYKAGNATGAEELATMAYIDNFEHVETELDQRNATELKEQIEQMLRVELVGLFRDRADSESIDAKIAAINGKLDEAIVIVPEFPATLAAIAAIAGVLAAVLYGRFKTASTYRS